MRVARWWCAALFAVSALAAPDQHEVAQLRLPDLDGNSQPLFTGNRRDTVVVFFIAPECPVSNRCIPTMRELAREFGGASVKFVGVYPEPDEPAVALKRHAAEFGLDFPLRLDREHVLVRRVGATFTPEAAILDGAGKLYYRGRIDDRFVDFGKERRQATSHEVREVLLAIRKGERPAFRTVKGFGCTISSDVPRQ